MMFSLTLQMVQKVVGRRILSWAVRVGGRGFGQQASIRKEPIFTAIHWETIAKTSIVQRCVLGHAVKVSVSVLGPSVGLSLQVLLQDLFHRRVFSRISMPRLIFVLVSLQLLKLNYRYGNKQTVCFFWSIFEAHQAWGTHSEVYTRHEVGAEVILLWRLRKSFQEIHYIWLYFLFY